MPKRRKSNQNGKGFMDVMKKIGGAFKKVGGFIKDNKLLSTVGGMIPIPQVQAAAKLAGAVGLGRKKKRGPKKGKAQSGKGMNLHGVRSGARAAPLKL